MNRTRSLVRRTAVVAASGAAALVLAACGGSGDDTGSAGHGGHQATDSASAASAPASQGRHNTADVTFAQGMIPTTARPWRWPTSHPTGRSRPR